VQVNCVLIDVLLRGGADCSRCDLVALSAWTASSRRESCSDCLAVIGQLLLIAGITHIVVGALVAVPSNRAHYIIAQTTHNASALVERILQVI